MRTPAEAGVFAFCDNGDSGGGQWRGRAWPWAAGIMIGILTLAVGAGGYVIAVQAQAIEQLRDVQGNAFRTLGALDDRVERVTGQQEQSTEDRMDVAAVYDRAVRSVLTVFCGDGQGTGLAYEATPRKGYKSIIVTNNYVIGGLLGVTTLGLDREGLNIAVHTRLFCEGILRCD